MSLLKVEVVDNKQVMQEQEAAIIELAQILDDKTQGEFSKDFAEAAAGET